jgi:glycosyltransferase involved in cell wall biosynthesis
MRQARFDVVHCHSTKAGLLGRIAARLARVPGVVFTAHGWPFAVEHGAVRHAAVLAERAVGRISSRIICVAEAVRNEALRLGIAAPEKLEVIHNGIDPSRWPADRRAAAGAEGRPCTAIFVGRLDRQKDPQTLVEAWSRLPGPHRLEVVGDGPLRPALEAMVRRLDLQERVRLHGAQDDVARRLGNADLLVLPSRWEGCPLVVIEAMMSGLPVVATDVGGVRELVVDGATGFLVSSGAPDALAAALGRLILDPALRVRMGTDGRARALERFTEARMLAQTGAVYERVLRRRCGAEPHA